MEDRHADLVNYFEYGCSKPAFNSEQGDAQIRADQTKRSVQAFR